MHSLLMRVDAVNGKTIITNFLLGLFVTKGEIALFVQLSILMDFWMCTGEPGAKSEICS